MQKRKTYTREFKLEAVIRVATGKTCVFPEGSIINSGLIPVSVSTNVVTENVKPDLRASMHRRKVSGHNSGLQSTPESRQ
jgi:hypothetical protein